MGMSITQNVLVTISLLGWLGFIIFELRRKQKAYLPAFWVQMMAIVLSAFLLHRFFGYFNSLEIKSVAVVRESLTLAGLYICTVLGVIGQHVFIQIQDIKQRQESENQPPDKKPKFYWLPVLKPLVISPLIFLAVLNELNKMGAQANTVTAVVTQCILAFQNGFFWKTVMEQLEKKIGGGTTP